MYIYVCVWLLFFFLALVNVKRKIPQSVGYFLIALLALFVGFREDIGTDWDTYKNIYYNFIYKINNVDEIFQMEPFFVLIGLICSLFSLSHCAFFTVLSFISLFTIWHVILRFKIQYPFLALFIFFCSFFFQFEMNVVRHGIMVSFVWLAFSYLKERNYKKTCLFFLCACCFHVLAACILPLIFFLKIKISKTFMIIATPLVFLSFLMHVTSGLISLFLGNIPLIGDKALFYMTSYYYYGQNMAYGMTAGALLNLAVLLFCFFRMRTLYSSDSIFRLILNAMFLSYVLICVLNDFSVFVERVVSLFNVANIFVYPYILKHLFKKQSNRLIGYLILSVYLCMIFYTNMTVPGPYKVYQFLPYNFDSTPLFI